uniref:Retrotransposon gag domain-containing protein n=1 Tax=Tanacetum cinerariifolium TaxID=118510 RepID=A0A699IP88_TANCI|nr:hypothetical protein [Tanacetum cinerariifolium]
MEIGIADVEAVIDMSIGDEVRAHINDGICMGVEVAASDIREDEEEFEAEASAGGMIKVEVDPRVKSVVNKDVLDHVIADGAVKVTYETLGDLVHRFHDHTEEIPVHQFRDWVDSLRHHMALSQEEFCQIYRDRDDLGGDLEDWSRLLRGEWKSWRGGNNKNGNLNENGRGAMPVVYTYQDFIKCQPLNFKGTEGVVGLTRWFEKMETVFHINNCPKVYQVKYATYTLLDSALTWWNSYKRIVGADVAFSMIWRDLMKLMTEVHCLRNEIQKIETKLWNLTMKNNDSLLCTRMVLGEEDQIERYVGGLPDNI